MTTLNEQEYNLFKLNKYERYSIRIHFNAANKFEIVTEFK